MQAKSSSYSSIWSAVNDAGGWILASAVIDVKSAPDSSQASLCGQRFSKAFQLTWVLLFSLTKSFVSKSAVIF